MKLSILLFFLLLVPALAEVTVSRSIINPAAEEQMTVTFYIRADVPSSFDFAELVPQTWKIDSWKIEGVNKDEVTFEEQANRAYNGSTYRAYHWKFSKPIVSAKLSYTTVPPAIGSFNFMAVWIFPNGFRQEAAEVSVKPGLISNLKGSGLSNPIYLGVALLVAVLVFLLLRKSIRKQAKKTRKK